VGLQSTVLLQLVLFRAISTIGADAVRRLYGTEGDGIVDSQFWYRCISHFAAFNLNLTVPPLRVVRDVNRALEDEYGWGTAKAGIVAGELEGKFKAVVRRLGPEGEVNLEQVVLTNITGVAPKCKLVSLKVLDEVGNGPVSNVLAAIHHIQEINGYGRNLRIHGVAIPLGFDYDHKVYACGLSPLCLEVDRLVRSGVVVVVAAGNTGSGTVKTIMGAHNTVLEGSINDPGNAELAITAGSTTGICLKNTVCPTSRAKVPLRTAVRSLISWPPVRTLPVVRPAA
jgi:hypothetical protein